MKEKIWNLVDEPMDEEFLELMKDHAPNLGDLHKRIFGRFLDRGGYYGENYVFDNGKKVFKFYNMRGGAVLLTDRFYGGKNYYNLIDLAAKDMEDEGFILVDRRIDHNAGVAGIKLIRKEK